MNIEIGPDGRLLLTSRDAAALDLLEELIAQWMPLQPDFKVFRLQYADAYWVTKNLEEFFKEDEDKGRGRGYFDYYYYYYYYDYPPPRKEESKKRLSKRPKLKFIYDYDTNSILVQGADPRQLKTIASLIEIYDKPEAPDAQTVRVHGVFHVRYSKAEVIAEAVKDVYRDLLSANDKALAQNPNQRERMSSQTTFIIGDSSGNEPGRTQAKFKGKLSIGVDTVSNTLLVSAEGESLLKSVGEMIQTLDEASRPMSAVSVVRVDGNVNAARVREVLSKVLAEESASAGQGRGSTPPRGPQQPGNRGGRSGQSLGRRGSG